MRQLPIPLLPHVYSSSTALILTILFDYIVERESVLYSIKHHLNLNPSLVTEMSTVEMPINEKEDVNDRFIGCTLTSNDHSFSVDLMPVPIESFDVIIGIDRLSSNHADILYYEKAIRLNLPSDQTLMIYGDKFSSNLHIISCIKVHKPSQKGMP